MFDDVPVRVWLLLAIAAVTFAPARYVYRHIAHAPSRRDITRPHEDLDWRTSGQFILNLSILAGLAGLAIFIFTPMAERFARSPNFLPVLMTGLGAWALISSAFGAATGRVRPFARGFDNTYERDAHPKRFWASLVWNAAFGVLCFWLAYASKDQIAEGSDWSQCFESNTVNAPGATLSACNGLIAKYSEAIRSDPNDSSAHYNRALVHEQVGNIPNAVADYDAAIRLAPDDPDGHFRRGLIFLESRRFDEAVTDFTRAHKLNPKDPWPLANRGITYAWKQDRASAEKDLSAAAAIDPENVVVMRGRALLSTQDADWESAAEYLTASLEQDPDNIWALQMRAWTFRQLGEAEKSQADLERLRQLGIPTAMNPKIG
jgi:tetratricopeptide (TPR) repeat protein